VCTTGIAVPAADHVHFAYNLTDLSTGSPGVGRTLGSLAARSPAQLARRIAEVGWDIASTGLLDALFPLKSGIVREAAGQVAPERGSLGIYLHWSPTGTVSAMVLRQLALWREAGFAMVFVSNAVVPERDWDAVGAHVVLRLQRRNVGMDFGAWRDAAVLAIARFGVPRELLLANDSVLGPFQPIEPLVAAWRAGGSGLFGMTESWMGAPHLQSYAVLAREAAVAEVLAHLAGFHDRRSKWQVVRQGEIGLSGRMAQAGIRRAALFGYARLCALTDEATRRGLGPRFNEPESMLRFPLNPTHHLWAIAVREMGFPYLKRELVMSNPGHLVGVDDWPSLVPNSTDVALIRDHLAVMRGDAGASRI
jgi:hypothetical protein